MILILKSKVEMRKEVEEKDREKILGQLKEGLAIIPPWYDAVYFGDDPQHGA